MARAGDVARRRIERVIATGATKLDLSGLRLGAVPDGVRRLTCLTALDLGENDLAELPGWLGELTQLTALWLWGNRITTLPGWLVHLARLEKLDLHGNQLAALPGWLTSFTQLTTLDLGGNQLTAMPDGLAALTQLQFLDLSDNGLVDPPEWLDALTQLTALSLGGNRLTELPERLAGLTRLESLYVFYNPLVVLPEWLAALDRLKTLSLSGTHVTVLPDWLAGLTRLEHLGLGDTRLASLPDWLANLTRLRHLNLGENRLAAVPDWVAVMTRLTYLRLNGNKLAALPDCLATLTELEYLDLGGNQLTAIPDGLANLTKLTTLGLGGNRLKAVPDGLAALTQLRYLDLGSNQLTSVPDGLAALTRLTQLDLNDNQFTVLPDWIATLGDLSRLSVQRNKLAALPEWLLDLPELLDLRVEDNPLVSPPPEITSSGATSVLEFLAAREEGSTRQWTSKMLVVGEGGVGKTSTIKALLGQAFDSGEQSTHGLRTYSLDIDHPELADTRMSLSTWDFGGQQIYHATHQFFLTDRSLFLLLWNNRLGWEQGRLRYWLNIIRGRAPQSPVLLIATNAPVGGRPVDLPLDDLRREYPQIVASLSLDNERRDGLAPLRAAIAHHAASLPLMGTEWPTRWLAAADAVRAIPAKHVPPSAMWHAMVTAGLRDAEHQRYVATALHQLGDILYYQDHPDLAETVILKPEWVNDYISMVLDSPEVERNHGLLTREHVNTLWADLDKGMRDHFLGMMERYDLSYRLDGASSTDLCIVVERLSWNAPRYRHVWEQMAPGPVNHEIKVIYQLDTTPPGIPTWFIARSHRFTTGAHWRTGALLADSDRSHLALIRTDTHRNTIELSVRGPSPASFSAVLNDGLAFTLQRYPGLSVTRHVPCPCAGPGQPPCTERFDYDQLQSRLNRTPPRYEIECRTSGRDVYVPLLLLGLAPSERDALSSSLERLTKTVTVQHTDLLGRLDDLSADMQRQFLKVQQHIKTGLETKCPSVFLITPAKNNKITGASYELRLYCEEPGAWHPLPADTGVYRFTESPAWLQRFGPHLRVLLDILQRAAPLAGPLLGMTLDKLNARTAADVQAMKALIDQLPDVPIHNVPLTKMDRQAAGPIERGSTEADFRALDSLLARLDPDRTWGGLSRVETPEGLALYLCPDHGAPYRRTPHTDAQIP